MLNLRSVFLKDQYFQSDHEINCLKELKFPWNCYLPENTSQYQLFKFLMEKVNHCSVLLLTIKFNLAANVCKLLALFRQTTNKNL